MSKNESSVVSRFAFLFLTGTLVSRLSGLGRDLSMAFCFGSHPAIAAFFVAYRFSNFMRRFFGEGNLNSGFIPYFESLRAEDPKKGAAFFRDLFFSLAFFLILLIAVLELSLFLWMKTGGLSKDTVQILMLVMIMLPGTLFICQFGLNAAFLQCEKKFFQTAVASTVFNLVWILAVWMLKGTDLFLTVFWLGVAIVIGFFSQMLFSFPSTWRALRKILSFKELFKIQLFSKDLKKVLPPFFLGLIGIGSVQINSALDAVFARFASVEGPAYLWYALRIEQLPLALFGIALSSALLPSLSRSMNTQDPASYLSLLRFGLSRSFSLIFPCTIALLVLGISGINLLYGRGHFNSDSAINTVICLWGYGIGLLPSVFVLLLAPAFYVRKDYKTPTKAALLSVALNIIFNVFLVFVFKLGAFSIAFATSLSAFFNAWYLISSLSKDIGPIFDGALIRSFLKTGFCSCFAGFFTVMVGNFITGDPTLSILFHNSSHELTHLFIEQVLHFFSMGGCFILILFSYAWLFQVKELLEFIPKLTTHLIQKR